MRAYYAMKGLPMYTKQISLNNDFENVTVFPFYLNEEPIKRMRGSKVTICKSRKNEVRK